MDRANSGSVGPRRLAPTTIAPSTEPGEGSSMALAPHLASIGHGRRWVAAQAARQGVGATGLRIVQLLASELIANAVLHGPPGGAVCVRTLPSEDRLRVEVDDADSTTRPRLLTRCHADDGGHGLRLVDRFADRWGYDLHGADGKTVWFEFVLPGARADRARRDDDAQDGAGSAEPPGRATSTDASRPGPLGPR